MNSTVEVSPGINHDINTNMNTNINMDMCIISCYFGLKNTHILPPPKQYDCYFFTNNPNIKKDIIKKGWIYKYVKLPVYYSKVISSLQSKFIKFLKFLQLKEYKHIRDYKRIMYVDHKHVLTNNNIDALLDIYNNSNKSILLRYCPVKNIVKNVYDEYRLSLNQQRYRLKQKETEQFIKNMVDNHNCNPFVRVCNTGLILYDMTSIYSLKCANETYNEILNIKNPQCQIVWNLVTQKYDEHILKIDYNKIPIKRYSL